MRPEYTALVAVVDPGSRGAAEALICLRSAAAWRRLCAAAVHEGVAGHAWFEMRRRRMGALIPHLPAARLRDAYEAALHTNTWRLRELRAITHALQDQGVNALPLDRGALFLHGAYPDRGVFQLDRLTIAVPAAARDVAVAVLMAAGHRLLHQSAAALEATSARATPIRFEFFAEPPAPDQALTWTASRLAAARTAARLADTVDRCYLERLDPALAMGEPAFADPRGLARAVAMRAPAPYWFGQLAELFFPPADEMLRRHGAHAAGWGLYRLYAVRLLRMRAALPGKRTDAS